MVLIESAASIPLIESDLLSVQWNCRDPAECISIADLAVESTSVNVSRRVRVLIILQARRPVTDTAAFGRDSYAVLWVVFETTARELAVSYSHRV